MRIKHFTGGLEIKSVSDEGTFSGYGSVFNVKDSWGDIVIKGAFANSLAEWAKREKLPKMLWQHRSAEPIGVWTLMKEDDRGLYVEGQILRRAGPTEERAYQHIKAGSVDGLSIGYSIEDSSHIEYSKEQDAYLLKQIKLWEVSPVTFPANEEATIDEVKAAIDGGPREFERFLRDAGLSRNQAKGLMALGYEGIRGQRDAEAEALEEVKKMFDMVTNALR